MSGELKNKKISFYKYKKMKQEYESRINSLNHEINDLKSDIVTLLKPEFVASSTFVRRKWKPVLDAENAKHLGIMDY